MPIFEEIAVTNPLASFAFTATDMAATQTDTALVVAGSTVTTYTALKAGWVVGFSVKLSAAVTAGTLTADFSIAGTAQAVDKTLATAATTSYRYEFPIERYRFAAGATLGMTFTSNGSLDPETIDAVAVLYVIYDDAVFR